MSNQKGLGVAQVFMFILAAVSFALIMIFGYKAISGFLQGGQRVEFIQFKTELETAVKRIYTEYGAVRIEQFHAPAMYHQICFVDLSKPADPALNNEDPLAYAAWQTANGDYGGLDENVFLTPSAPVKIKVHDIKMDDPDKANDFMTDPEKDYLCIPIENGGFSLRLEGRGSYTLLAPTPAPSSP